MDNYNHGQMHTMKTVCGIIGSISNFIPSMIFASSFSPSMTLLMVFGLVTYLIVQCTPIIGQFAEPIVQIWALVYVIINFSNLKTILLILYFVSVAFLMIKYGIILYTVISSKKQ